MSTAVSMPSESVVLEGNIDEIQRQLKGIIQSLYNLISTAYRFQGPDSQGALKTEIQRLVSSLVELSRSAPNVVVDIPPDVIQYVENARNPDIFTREFVELVQRMNQMLKGRNEAYAQMRDVLAKDIVGAIPELKDDVRRVVESTGGKLEI